MGIIGYKAFDKGLINRYGTKFEVGKIYIAEGAVKFGNQGNGFHLCKNMEDTFRYFDGMESEIDICKVKGSGDAIEYYDEYYGYYDMYAVSELEILSKLSREEIIDYALRLNDIRIKRFLSGYKLTDEELDIFINKYKNSIDVKKVIDYYQKKELDAFTRGCK